MSAIQHLLMLVIILISPIANIILLQKLKDNSTSIKKEHAYILIYLGYWIFFLLLITFYPLHQLFFPKFDLHFPLWLSTTFILVWIWGIAANIGPMLTFDRNKAVRNTILESYESDRHILPWTVKQQRMMVFVAITVGITEEFIFRGFVYNYLHEQFGLTLWWSFILAASIFGLGHFHQGLHEIVPCIIFGLVMGFLYYVTGSLMIPIIFHVLYDLKIVVMTRKIKRYENSPGL